MQAWKANVKTDMMMTMMMMMMMMMMMSLKAASFPSEVLGKNSQMPKTDLLVILQMILLMIINHKFAFFKHG